MPDQNKEYLHHVVDCFSIHANPDHAAPMESYMKHKVKFFGIKTPERKALTRSIIQDVRSKELVIQRALSRF